MAVTKQPRDVRCGSGNLVNNVVMAVRGAGRAPDSSRGSLCKLHKSLTTLLFT